MMSSLPAIGFPASSNPVRILVSENRFAVVDDPRPNLIQMPAESAHLSHHTEDGPEIDYWVFEEVPPEVPSLPSEAHDFPFMSEPLDAPHRDFDERAPTLKLDIPSLTVHHVSGINFQTDAQLDASPIREARANILGFPHRRRPSSPPSVAMAICAGAGWRESSVKASLPPKSDLFIFEHINQ
jgi:hypothetical protein